MKGEELRGNGEGERDKDGKGGGRSHPVGHHEVADGSALGKELRVREDLKLHAGLGAVAVEGPTVQA